MQAYWDYTHRDHPQQFEEHLHTLDLEAQYGFRTGAHEILVGGGYRHARDRVVNSAQQAFLPPDRSLAWANAFVQDRIELSPQLALTLGAKVERNDYTGTEFLPSARVAWQPTGAHMFWAAASRRYTFAMRRRMKSELATNTSTPLAVRTSHCRTRCRIQRASHARKPRSRPASRKY